MSEIRLPPNNAKHHESGTSYSWEIMETGSKTLRIYKRMREDDEIVDRLFPEFTGFNSLREAMVKFFSVHPTQNVVIGGVVFYFDESSVDGIGPRFCTAYRVQKADVAIWALKWLEIEHHSLADNVYTGFFATMDDYRAIKRWKYPLPKKYTVVGCITETNVFIHIHAKDIEQACVVAELAYRPGTMHVFEGHLKDVGSLTDNTLTPADFYERVRWELQHTTDLVSDQVPNVRPCKDTKADLVNVGKLLAEYCIWYTDHHTLKENTR